jgi:hypothetical protein
LFRLERERGSFCPHKQVFWCSLISELETLCCCFHFVIKSLCIIGCSCIVRQSMTKERSIATHLLDVKISCDTSFIRLFSNRDSWELVLRHVEYLYHEKPSLTTGATVNQSHLSVVCKIAMQLNSTTGKFVLKLVKIQRLRNMGLI